MSLNSFLDCFCLYLPNKNIDSFVSFKNELNQHFAFINLQTSIYFVIKIKLYKKDRQTGQCSHVFIMINMFIHENLHTYIFGVYSYLT